MLFSRKKGEEKYKIHIYIGSYMKLTNQKDIQQ